MATYKIGKNIRKITAKVEIIFDVQVTIHRDIFL